MKLHTSAASTAANLVERILASSNYWVVAQRLWLKFFGSPKSISDYMHLCAPNTCVQPRTLPTRTHTDTTVNFLSGFHPASLVHAVYAFESPKANSGTSALFTNEEVHWLRQTPMHSLPASSGVSKVVFMLNFCHFRREISWKPTSGEDASGLPAEQLAWCDCPQSIAGFRVTTREGGLQVVVCEK